MAINQYVEWVCDRDGYGEIRVKEDGPPAGWRAVAVCAATLTGALGDRKLLCRNCSADFRAFLGGADIPIGSPGESPSDEGSP